jgi:hypothetical protein
MHEKNESPVADTVTDNTNISVLRRLQQGSIVRNIAFGPRAGRKVLELGKKVDNKHL